MTIRYDDGETASYQVVGTADASPEQGRFSTESPIGRALLGAKAGDTVPGVGRVDSIVRWGNRWIVATSRGLISTQN